MGFIDRLLGRDDDERRQPEDRRSEYGRQPGRLSDEQAIERYRYMLRTAPPDAIEQAHAEAFEQLTPEQRRMVLQGLSQQLPPQERAQSDDPRSLARMATRAELRQPGVLERTFGGMGGGGFGMGGGIGMGGLLAGGFLATMAGSFVGTAIAQQFFDNDTGYSEGYQEGYADAGAAEETGQAEAYDAGSAGNYGDTGGTSDFSGDIGGDLGGGDFGGGGEF